MASECSVFSYRKLAAIFGSYYITGDEWGKKNRLKYVWSAGNKINTSYRDISVTVAENDSVVKPKYQQYTSLNNNDGKYIFYCYNKQWRHRKRHRWHLERHQELYLRLVTCCVTCVTKKENQNRGPQMNSPTLSQQIFKFFATSPFPIGRFGQAFMVISPRIAANYGL